MVAIFIILSVIILGNLLFYQIFLCINFLRNLIVLKKGVIFQKKIKMFKKLACSTFPQNNAE